MKLLIAVFGSLLLLAIAAFCIFGFMATFEPTDNALALRRGLLDYWLRVWQGITQIADSVNRHRATPPIV